MELGEIHSCFSLEGLSLRASLKATGTAEPSRCRPAWMLISRWVGKDDEPLIVRFGLRIVTLGGSDCCVVYARAITPGKGNPKDEDHRAFAYLLHPADTCVWEATDRWLQIRAITAQTGPRCDQDCSVMPRDFEVVEARYAEGEELDSDMLAGAIQKLIAAGQLEAEVAKQLDIKVLLYCAVVETPMILNSLQSVDEQSWRLHKEHEMNTWLHQGIWS